MFRTAKTLFLSASLLIVASSAVADKTKASMSNTRAPQGGTFYYPLTAEPERLHPINSSDMASRYVQAYVIEGLMRTNLTTYEPEPALAESVTEAKDGMSYTFKLRKGLKFSNGEPVTAEVVKWNYDARMNDDYQAFNIRPYLENVKEVKVVDPLTVKFVLKKKYFANKDAIGSASIMGIVPKSVYGDPKDKKANKKLVGTGPYMLKSYKKGRDIILVRNPSWWGKDYNEGAFKDIFNFDKIHFKVVKDENNRLALLQRNKLDYDQLTAEQYMKKTKGPAWGKKVFKKEVQNNAPVSYGYVGWNFKKKIFQDRNVRKALAHLMDRDTMNEKFRYGKSLLATGPWYQQSPYANKSIKPIPFDVKKAQALLKKAGWTDSDKDGLLDKKIDGKKTPFVFSIMYANKDSEKYFTLYKEGLKKAGIQANLKLVEWNTLVKSLDEQKFEAVALGWGGGSVDNDPKQIWHSDSSKKGGSNFISYKNTKVDKLIDEGRQVLDKNKRIKMWNKVYKLIADDAPYAFMFNNKYIHYAHGKKIGKRKDTMAYGVGINYWWVQP